MLKASCSSRHLPNYNRACSNAWGRALTKPFGAGEGRRKSVRLGRGYTFPHTCPQLTSDLPSRQREQNTCASAALCSENGAMRSREPRPPFRKSARLLSANGIVADGSTRPSYHEYKCNRLDLHFAITWLRLCATQIIFSGNSPANGDSVIRIPPPLPVAP